MLCGFLRFVGFVKMAKMSPYSFFMLREFHENIKSELSELGPGNKMTSPVLRGELQQQWGEVAPLTQMWIPLLLHRQGYPLSSRYWPLQLLVLLRVVATSPLTP